MCIGDQTRPKHVKRLAAEWLIITASNTHVVQQRSSAFVDGTGPQPARETIYRYFWQPLKMIESGEERTWSASMDYQDGHEPCAAVTGLVPGHQ